MRNTRILIKVTDERERTMTAQERLSFSIKELVALSGVGRTRIYDEIPAGRLLARKLGYRTLVLSDDAGDWLTNLPHFHDDSKTKFAFHMPCLVEPHGLQRTFAE